MAERIESENADEPKSSDALGWLIIAARNYNGHYYPDNGSPETDPEYGQAYTSTKYLAEWTVIKEAWYSFVNKLIQVNWADYYEPDWGDIGMDPIDDYYEFDPDNTEHEERSNMELMYPNPEDLEYETDYFDPEH